MFDLDAGKILVVGVVALIVIGPKDLPRVLRTVGQTVGKMRRMASEFQNQFMDAIKEADLEDVKKEFSAIRDAAGIDTALDPAALMRDEMTSAVEGPKDIGHSTIDLTGTGPMKEIGGAPADAAPQEIGSLAASPPAETAGEAPVTSADLTGAGPVAHVASEPQPALPEFSISPNPSIHESPAPRPAEAEPSRVSEPAERADAEASQGGHG
jgi:sec-independent protein translocase protein TatB